MLINIFVRSRRSDLDDSPSSLRLLAPLTHWACAVILTLLSGSRCGVFAVLCCCFSLSLPPPPSTSLSHLPLSQPPCRVPHQAKQSSPPLLQPDLVFATTFLYHLPLFAFLLFFLFFNTHLSHSHITHTHNRPTYTSCIRTSAKNTDEYKHTTAHQFESFSYTLHRIKLDRESLFISFLNFIDIEPDSLIYSSPHHKPLSSDRILVSHHPSRSSRPSLGPLRRSQRPPSPSSSLFIINRDHHRSNPILFNC